MRKFDLDLSTTSFDSEKGLLTVHVPEQTLSTDKFCSMRVGGITLTRKVEDISNVEEVYKETLKLLLTLLDTQFEAAAAKHKDYLDRVRRMFNVTQRF